MYGCMYVRVCIELACAMCRYYSILHEEGVGGYSTSTTAGWFQNLLTKPG